MQLCKILGVVGRGYSLIALASASDKLLMFLFRVKDALNRKPNFQTQYQLIFVVWVMTLDSNLATSISR